MRLNLRLGGTLAAFAAGMLLSVFSVGCNKKSGSSNTSETPAVQDGGSQVRRPRWQTEQEYQTMLRADRNNLKLIGMGMHAYADAWREVLPTTICATDGRPLLSWRVAILPYVEYAHVFEEFKLDEPWDSEHNKKLISKMPKLYLLPGSGNSEDGYTHYRVFVAPANAQGNHPIFTKPMGTTGGKFLNRFKINNIPDGTSNTILVAESEDPVIWTRPEELDYDDRKPIPKLGYFWKDSTNVVMGDGSFRGISRRMNEKTLRLAITADDYLPLPNDFWQ